MIFCKVDNALVELIKKYAGRRTIVDCGCGEGLLGSMLPGIISIDLFAKENSLIADILQMDATEFPFASSHFPVFLRPCHGHFVGGVLYRHKDSLINCLYVSMSENLEVDIDLDEFEVQQVGDWAGSDGEKAYLITLNGGKKMKEGSNKYVRLACLIDVKNNQTDGKSFWRLEEGGMWINSVGGRMHVHEATNDFDWAVIETVFAGNFEDLDWSKTYLNNPKEKSGWLAPDGTFYGCPSQSHGDCAYHLLKKEEGELEEAGYVRIYSQNEWICFSQITEAQAEFLIKGEYADKHAQLQDIKDKLSLGKDWSAAMKFIRKDGD